MTNGISAQGTLLERSPDPNWPDNDPQGGGIDFVAIAELTDMTPPGLTRNPIETTSHNEADDRYIVGIRRHSELSVNINFIPSDPTQDHLTGLQDAWFRGTRDVYRLTFPDGTKWLFSGFVTGFEPDAPVDDRLSADVTIRPTGQHAWESAS